MEESPLCSELGPSTQDQKGNELELNQLWWPWVVVGRQPLIRGVCHVTPSGNGKSWRGAAGSGSSAGPWPGSRGHWEARAMVRAREAPASSATASTMLGTAVFRAAFLESPHQSNTGLQKAQSLPLPQYPLLQMPAPRQTRPWDPGPGCRKGPVWEPGLLPQTVGTRLTVQGSAVPGSAGSSLTTFYTWEQLSTPLQGRATAHS